MTGPYERRAFPLTLRSDGGDTPQRIVGHAAVFESDSEEMGFFMPFRERIRVGAFDGALARVASGKDAVYALLNHDENIVIASTVDHTLDLSTDEVGLVASMEPMDTQTIRDLVITPIRQGKIRKMSFGFTVADEHEEKRDGAVTRVIDSVARLFDVSPVVFPAYPATDISARRLRALGLDPARLDLREALVARAFLETFRTEYPPDECETCGHARSSHPDDGACKEDDGCEEYKSLHNPNDHPRLPEKDGKVAALPVAPPISAGAAIARLRELELRERDLNLYLGSKT